MGRAIIVLKPGTSLTAADLTARLRERMTNYKAPKSVVFVDALPKTGANKVDKPKLKEAQNLVPHKLRNRQCQSPPPAGSKS